MAAPLFVSYTATAYNSSTSPKATASISVVAGDILVATSDMEGYDTTGGQTAVIVPTGGSLTWTSQQEVLVNNYNVVRVSTAVASSTTSFAVTFTESGSDPSSLFWGGSVTVWRNSDGVGASSKTNVSGAAPSLSITTTQDESAIVTANGDWNAVDGTSRTWRTVNSVTPTSGNGYEKLYFRDAARYAAYAATYPDAGTAGAKTVGLSAPGGQKYSIAALEIKGTASSGAITGSTSAAFSASGVLQGAGVLAGASAASFTPVGVLRGSGALAGATAAAFTPVGVLRGTGALAGSSAAAFAPTGTLRGTGALAGTSAATFSASGTFTSNEALTGAISVAFTTAGVLRGTGILAGSSAAAFSTAGVLRGSGALAGTSAVTFAVSGSFGSALAGTIGVVFTASGTLRGTGVLSGLSASAFTATGALGSLTGGAITGSAAMVFTATGTLSSLIATRTPRTRVMTVGQERHVSAIRPNRRTVIQRNRFH